MLLKFGKSKFGNILRKILPCRIVGGGGGIIYTQLDFYYDSPTLRDFQKKCHSTLTFISLFYADLYIVILYISFK